MKILVISMLRLGDVLMTEPILKALRRKHKDASVDVLVNDSFSKKLEDVISADKILSFPRQVLQQDLTSPSVGVMQAFIRLENVINEIKKQGYDYVINLTQNKLSARLIAELNVPMLDGFTLNGFDQPYFSSKWFRYLNNANGQSQTPQFHMVDVFAGGLGLRPVTELPLKTNHNRISIQLLTSDKKKNWSLESWQSFIRLFRQLYPKHQIDVLGAAFESSIVNKFVTNCNAENLDVNAKILSLAECLEYLSTTDLLITGDTSIKHLAIQSPCRVIEIALGSSEPEFTGVYKTNSLIVSSKAGCSPCVHSESCTQQYHMCEELIEPELIQLLAVSLLNSDLSQIRTISQEFSDSAVVRIVNVDSDGYDLVAVSNAISDKELQQNVDRLVWRFYLSDEYLNPISEIGSRSHRICRKIKEQGAGSFQGLQNWVSHQENTAEKNYKTSCQLLHKVSFDRDSIINSNDTRRDLDELILGNAYLGIRIATHTQNMQRDYLEKSEINFKSLRLLQENLNTAKNLFEIKKKVYRTIKSEMMEKI